VDLLNEDEPAAANMLHFHAISPLPSEGVDALSASGARTIVVEGNATGQFEGMLRGHAGVRVAGSVRRYDGRAFTPEYIAAGVREVA
jgi:pyruvate/2-oxoacid:ferredoxin oxidoreductase alpha subunit